jgi:hypothetical protein
MNTQQHTLNTTEHNSQNYNMIKEQLVQVIFTNITSLNGENTEEDLNMLISEKIAEDKLNTTEVVDATSLKGCISNRIQSELDLENIEPNGAWLYKDNTSEEWMFDRYDTIADAVRAAINMINATIICDAHVIPYDKLDADTAYYVDDRTDSVRIVELNKKATA